MIGLTQFATSTSGIGALGIDGSAFIIQLLTFLLALWLLRRFAFKPILKVLTERRKVINDGVELGEAMKKKEAELAQKVAATLHEARSQADNIVAQSEQQARQTIQAAEETARQKADALVDEAGTRINQEASRARQKLQNELVGLVSDATEIIIHEKIDSKKDAELIDLALRGRG